MVGVYSGFKIHSTFAKFERDIISFLFQWQPKTTKENCVAHYQQYFFIPERSKLYIFVVYIKQFKQGKQENMLEYVIQIQ